MSYISTAGGGNPANIIDPSAYNFVFDDFITGGRQNTNGALFVSAYGWGSNFAGSGNIDGVSDAAAVGTVQLQTGATNGNITQMFLAESTTGPSFINIFSALSATTFDFKFRVKLGQTTTITVRAGFYDVVLGTSEASIQYDTSVGDTLWTATTVKAGASNTRSVITGSTVDFTNFHTLRIRSLVAGTMLFSVDGGAEISIATNIPTVALSPILTVITRASGAETIRVDYIWGWVAITR